MNNSLAPIKSLAASLESLLRREALPPDWKADASAGLNSIASRGDSLDRPLQAYRSLTKLSPPQTQGVDLRKLVRQVVDLEPKLRVKVTSSPKTVIRADAAQVEQALINLVHHAVDASLENNWQSCDGLARERNVLEIFVQDERPGIMNAANPFVPFFTTKPDGSGIGLPLSRQITEANGGSLVLMKRRETTRGAEALLCLPLQAAVRSIPKLGRRRPTTGQLRKRYNLRSKPNSLFHYQF
jgi:two-component system, NtrC family, nitrogen regulation sensor histidine kinase NtrY